MEFKLNKVINGVEFDMNFTDKVCVFKGSSGTGKTFLFDTLKAYCVSHDIKCAYIDYTVLSNGDVDIIYNMCKNKELIILDNADLYLTSDLYNKIKDLNGIILLSKKSTFGLDATLMHSYIIKYQGSKLEVIRR